MTSKTQLKLKRLAIAYLAAQEFDLCPDASKASRVQELFCPDISTEEIQTALSQRFGDRPYQIAGDIVSTIIMQSNPAPAGSGE